MKFQTQYRCPLLSPSFIVSPNTSIPIPCGPWMAMTLAATASLAMDMALPQTPKMPPDFVPMHPSLRESPAKLRREIKDSRQKLRRKKTSSRCSRVITSYSGRTAKPPNLRPSSLKPLHGSTGQTMRLKRTQIFCLPRIPD